MNSHTKIEDISLSDLPEQINMIPKLKKEFSDVSLEKTMEKRDILKSWDENFSKEFLEEYFKKNKN
jgi:hypothetical protein